MKITLDKLMGMKPQAICRNKDLLQEFAEDKLNKGGRI